MLGFLHHNPVKPNLHVHKLSFWDVDTVTLETIDIVTINLLNLFRWKA